MGAPTNDVSLRRSDGTDATIAAPVAAGTWLLVWVVGNVVAFPAALVAGASSDADLTIVQLAVAASATWAVMLAGLVWVSRRHGSGRFDTDYAVAVRPLDLLAVPLGVGLQLALPILYWPLRSIWPETFSTEEIEARARDLAERADGFDVFVLALVVIIGAPIVEELVYRGLLQRSLTSRAGRVTGLMGASLLFAVVHFSPVEYPGLFVAGLLFGGCLLVTGRLGSAILAHAAFNATGLIVVLNSTS